MEIISVQQLLGGVTVHLVVKGLTIRVLDSGITRGVVLYCCRRQQMQQIIALRRELTLLAFELQPHLYFSVVEEGNGKGPSLIILVRLNGARAIHRGYAI